MTKTEIAANIKHWRKHRKVTVVDLSLQTGLMRKTIHKIESGRYNYEIDSILTIAMALNVPLVCFFVEGIHKPQ